MSAFLDMISAFIAFLMSAAFLHFGAVDGTALHDTPESPPAAVQGHSESTLSAPPAAQPVAAETTDTASPTQPGSPQRTAWK